MELLRGWWQQKNNQEDQEETFDKWLTSFTQSYYSYDNAQCSSAPLTICGVGVWEKEGKTMEKVEIISNETCCNPLHPHQELEVLLLLF